ncbi:hypothetical protein Hanom_Chr07g00675441 [Helianthus anomalus]
MHAITHLTFCIRRCWSIGLTIHTSIFFNRVKYTDGPCGLPKFWVWSLVF